MDLVPRSIFSLVSTNLVDIDNLVPQEGGQVNGAIKKILAFDATMHWLPWYDLLLISKLIDHFNMTYTLHILDQVKTLSF